MSTYIRSIFADRIEKREAHLRWAAELTQTGEHNIEAVKGGADPRLRRLDPVVRLGRATRGREEAGALRVAAAPKFDPRSTLPLATKSASPGGPPRPAAGTPAIRLGVRAVSAPAPQPVAPPPLDRSAPLADLESMEDDGPTIMAPTPTEEEYDDNDATQVAAKVDISKPAQPPAPRVAPVRPAAGQHPSHRNDDGDSTRAQVPMVNTAINVPPRPLPPRAPNQAPAPAPVMVAPPPMQQQMQQQQQQQMPPQPLFSPAAFAPTYSPNDPRLAPASVPARAAPFPQQQQPTMMLPQQRRGVPMWLVGAVSGVAALMVLLVVYLLAVPLAVDADARPPPPAAWWQRHPATVPSVPLVRPSQPRSRRASRRLPRPRRPPALHQRPRPRQRRPTQRPP